MKQPLISTSSTGNIDGYEAYVVQYPNYNMAVFAKESLSMLAKPLGITTIIPALAAIGSMSATVFSSTVSPLAGAVILGNFGAVGVYTAVVLSLLLSNPNVISNNSSPALGISVINSMFFTHTTSTASLSYLRMVPISFHDAAVVTIGGIAIALIYLYVASVAYYSVPFAPSQQSHNNN